jgi:hypothetical protein
MVSWARLLVLLVVCLFFYLVYLWLGGIGTVIVFLVCFFIFVNYDVTHKNDISDRLDRLDTHLTAEKFFGWLFSGKHYASGIVKRSSRQAAEEFARALEAQHFDDMRARELFSQMGAIRQSMWRAKYNERRKEAERLRDMLSAQAAALNADADLGESVLNRERAHRRRYER